MARLGGIETDGGLKGGEAVIRPYRSEDALATLDVFEQAIRRAAAAFYEPEQIAAWASGGADLSAWDAPRSAAWTVVAESDGRVVGFSDLAADGLLDMLFVHPDHGGRGVARALVEAVLARAQDTGVRRVETHASRAARPAFEKFGFVVDAENPNNMVQGVKIPNFDMHIDL
ncbi:GNAT family N-acetyltransferase [Mariniluteicoccus flavus]